MSTSDDIRDGEDSSPSSTESEDQIKNWFSYQFLDLQTRRDCGVISEAEFSVLFLDLCMRLNEKIEAARGVFSNHELEPADEELDTVIKDAAPLWISELADLTARDKEDWECDLHNDEIEGILLDLLRTGSFTAEEICDAALVYFGPRKCAPRDRDKYDVKYRHRIRACLERGVKDGRYRYSGPKRKRRYFM